MADLSQSRQDYLETILELARETGSVRSVDVAEKLGVSRASVSRAVGVLKQAGYIEQEPYGEIRLTELGRQSASRVSDTHRILKDFLLRVLKLDEETAEADACRMEHSVSPETIKALEQFLQTY